MEREEEIKAGMAAVVDKTAPGTKAEIALARVATGEIFDSVEDMLTRGDTDNARVVLRKLRVVIDGHLAGAESAAPWKRAE